ncbi:MAG TPA: hypothetical protein VKV39_11025 [Candidatus Sulfotelmatobacter sp.]|nr:hypothetical protein [Candidatus Sulfotelmatobacter sp.]
MKVTRRDLFVWGAGAAAGLVFSPVPWKLLDDTSIWSQNWPWIPQPARSPVEVKQSFCSLCPQGCALKVRMAGGWPIGVAGVSTSPVTRGALCPLGYGAHQLNWHPRRLQAVRHKESVSSWGAAQTAFAKACGEGPVIVIDGYPGRAASSILEAFAEKRGSYRVALSPELGALAPYERWSGVPANALGYDLENARTIVSGAPMLDGWGSPGRFTRLWAESAAGAKDPQLRLIQIEDSFSRTGSRAWQSVRIRSGSESALAAGLAHVLLDERLVPARGPIPRLTLADAAAQAGISEDAIRELARTMVERRPTLVISNDENPQVAALNVLLAATGARGGIVRRTKGTRHLPADAVNLNARAILIDAKVPWNFTPETDAEIFRFAAWDDGTSKSDWLLPAPGFLEELTDIPAAPTSAIETYAVAPALSKPRFEVQSAAQFLGNLDPSLGTTEKLIHGRCNGLFRERKGTLYGAARVPLEKFDSVQKVEEQLWKGAIWTGDPPSVGGWRCELKEWPQDPEKLRSRDWASEWPAAVLPPLAVKLYQESTLREAPERRNA